MEGKKIAWKQWENLYTEVSFFYFSLERMAKTLLHVLDYYLPHKGEVETVFEQIIGRSLQESYEAIVLTSHYVYKSKVNRRYKLL